MNLVKLPVANCPFMLIFDLVSSPETRSASRTDDNVSVVSRSVCVRER